MICGQCTIKDAELKAANEYIDQIEKALIAMADTVSDYFHFMLPDIETLMPASTEKMKECIRQIEKFKADLLEENQKRNETNTGLQRSEPGSDALQERARTDEGRGPIGDGAGHPDDPSRGR